MPNVLSLIRPSLQILGKNSDSSISDFRNPDQSLIKENCHNSRTSNDTDMKFRPVTIPQKKKVEDDVILVNCDVIVLIYGKFEAAWKADSGRLVCKSDIFIKSNLFSYKNSKQN